MPEQLDDEKIEKIKEAWYRWEELKKEGTIRPLKDMAEGLGVSVNTLKKYKPDDIEPDNVEEMAKGKAEGKVISEVIKQVSEEATGEHARIVVIGKYIKDKYEEVAKMHGLNVEDYIDNAVSFFELNNDRVKDLEQDNKRMEAYLKALLRRISKEEIAERLLTNAINTAVALGTEIKTEELRKIVKLAEEIDVAKEGGE